jgi:hypothetical protein
VLLFAACFVAAIELNSLYMEAPVNAPIRGFSHYGSSGIPEKPSTVAWYVTEQ